LKSLLGWYIKGMYMLIMIVEVLSMSLQ